MTRRACITLVALLGCESPGHQPSPVTHITDGQFAEWADVPVAIDDPADAPTDAAIDIGAVRIADDSQYVHLDVDVRRGVNLQAMRGTLHIVFDADGDDATGATVYGLTGADIVLELSMRESLDDDAGADVDSPANDYGAGIGIRRVSSNGPGPIRSAYDAGVLVAPTYSASRFELRLRRGNVAADLGDMWTADEFDVRLVFEDATGVRDESAVATYSLRQPASRAGPASVEIPAKARDAWRVVEWNVAHTAFAANPNAFARVLNALSPDVLLLTEVYGDIREEVLDRFFRDPPLGGSFDWQYDLSESGGTQRALVASRLLLRGDDRLLDVQYPAETVQRVERDEDPAFRTLFARERRVGMSAAGAWVATEVGGPLREILFLSLDLQSGGYDGSPRDRLRVLQAATLGVRMSEIIAGMPEGYAVVVAGDFNLVGSFEPLDLARTRLGPGGQDLAIVDAYRLSDRSQATWADRNDIFTPGRLDYMLFSAGTLELIDSFVFDLDAISAENRAQLGIRAGAGALPSDHFPIVADFRWKN